MGRDWGSQPQLSYWGDFTVRFIISDCVLLSYRENEVAGYVYYEVDNFDDIRNPFMSLETEDPSMARVRSSPPERERRITRARFHKEPTWSKQRPVGPMRANHRWTWTNENSITRPRVCQEKQRNLTGPGRERRKEVMDAFDIAFSKAWKSKPLEV